MLQRRRVAIGAVLVVVLIGTATVGASLARASITAGHDRTQLVTAGAVAEELETTSISQAASVRDYFLSADGGSLKQYNTQRAHTGDLSSRLQTLLSNTAVQAQLTDVAATTRAWRAAIEPLISLQQAGGRSDEVVRRYRDDRVASIFQTIAAATHRLRANLNASINTATARSDAARNRALLFPISAAAAALALVSLTPRVIRRWHIANPIELERVTW